MLAGGVPQRPAQRVDALAEVAFLDDGGRPDGLQDGGFVDELARAFDQEEQDVEGAGR